MASPINTSWAVLAVSAAVLAVSAAVLAVSAAVLAVLAAVLAVLAAVLAVLAAVLAVLYLVSYTRCDLILYVNVKPPFRFNSDGVGGVTRKRCKPFHYSARTVAQCRTGNRRRRTVTATEPNRAAVEIALPCTCAPERRAPGAILSTHRGRMPKILSVRT
jgi:hypothetical protein